MYNEGQILKILSKLSMSNKSGLYLYSEESYFIFHFYLLDLRKYFVIILFGENSKMAIGSAKNSCGSTLHIKDPILPKGVIVD